jgi:hypothetical protein
MRYANYSRVNSNRLTDGVRTQEPRNRKVLTDEVRPYAHPKSEVVDA